MRTNGRRGAVVILVALLMVVLLAFGAFAVDLSQMQAYKSELQRTADAAALAAGLELVRNPAGAQSVAGAYVATNLVMGNAVDSAKFEYGMYSSNVFAALPPTEASVANAFRVTVWSGGQFYLAQILSRNGFSVKAMATAWLPISASRCVKPWAIRVSDLVNQLGPNWSTYSNDALRSMSDDLGSSKVFLIKSKVGDAFAGVVNLPPFFASQQGLYYPGTYSPAQYEQAIASGCQLVSVDDSLQTKIGAYNPETFRGMTAGTPTVCAFFADTSCYNAGGQVGVAVRIAAVEESTNPSTRCATTVLDQLDLYRLPPPPHVLCDRVVGVLTFVLTHVYLGLGETVIYGSYAGQDSVGPVRAFAQRPILVQ